MRGDGSIFLRGRIWWIAYCFGAGRIRKARSSVDERAQRSCLRQRLKQVGKPNFVDPPKRRSGHLPT